jgi:hypothetical protein
MAEERTLGLAPARDVNGQDDSKEALQRRMELARDSITNTVTEIKENVAQQVETVKEALDWREHFKKAPVAWSLGAAGVGFFVGYGLAAAIKGDDDDQVHYSRAVARPLVSSPYLSQRDSMSAPSTETNGKNGSNDGPGMLERLRDTSAYERLSKEAGVLGDRLVEELSATAQAVVLPALLKKLKTWIGVDLMEKSSTINGNPSITGNQRSPAMEKM